MIELTIDGNSYDIAENWDEISFSKYIQLTHLNKDENLNEITRAISIIAALSNDPEPLEKALYQLTQEEFNDIATNFEWTNQPIEKFCVEKETIEIDGKTYKIKKNYNKLTLGELVSVETLIAQNKNLDQLEIVFGVLLREIDADGNEKDFNEDDFFFVISELQTKVMLVDVYSCISFFLSGDKSFSKTSKGYSIQKKKKKISPVE